MSAINDFDKRKRKNVLIYFAIAIAAFAIIGAFVENEKKDLPLNKQEVRVEKIKSLFSLYDGSCYAVEKYIKEHLNDADSYEHVKTEYAIQKDDKILVKTTYRGSNALGTKVINTNRFLIDLEGNIISVE